MILRARNEKTFEFQEDIDINLTLVYSVDLKIPPMLVLWRVSFSGN